MATLPTPYDRALSRKARAALRAGARLLVEGPDRDGYFSVYRLNPDTLLGCSDCQQLIRELREADARAACGLEVGRR